MMGASEPVSRELDATPIPLQVETDFLTVEEASAIEKEGIKNNQHRLSPIYLTIEPDDLIKTGYNKISLHRKQFYQRDPLSDTCYSREDGHVLYQSFNFMFFKDEVYLVPILHDDLSTLSSKENDQLKDKESNKPPIQVIDYAEGWKHQLLVVEKEENN
jgi:hypothetical protein